MDNTVMNYDKQYDVFLSYRRDGGEATAILLRERLVDKGYNVFLDIEELRSGSFNTRLLDVIENCKDFVLIGSINSLERCKNDGDWVRLEIAHAFKHNKNIIPVMFKGFTFPDDLPEDIAELPNQNGVDASRNEYFDAAIERLTDKFLRSEPKGGKPKPKETSAKKKPSKFLTIAITAILSVTVIAVAAIIFAMPLIDKLTASDNGTSIASDETDETIEVENQVYSQDFDFMTVTGLYSGEWSNGMPNGEGKFVTETAISDGMFKDGKENGRVIITWTNGDKYDGECLNGYYHGEGVHTNADGSTIEGEFMFGELWNGVKKDDMGEVIYTFENGMPIFDEMLDDMSDE